MKKTILFAGTFQYDDSMIDLLRDSGHEVYYVENVGTLGRRLEHGRPDFVILKGDPEHVARILEDATWLGKCPVIAYVAAEGCPLVGPHLPSLGMATHVVCANDFTLQAIRDRLPDKPMIVIKTHVDIVESVERRWSEHSRKAVLEVSAIEYKHADAARLLKAWRAFVMPWVSCGNCGVVSTWSGAGQVARCGGCGATSNFNYGTDKPDAKLRLVTRWGKALDMVKNFDLQHSVELVDYMKSYQQEAVHRINAADLFVSTSCDRRWCSRILKIMAAGTPTLLPQYGPLVNLVMGKGEMIELSDYVTDEHTLVERGVVDIQDMVMKMDRFYYDADTFILKWGVAIAGEQPESLRRFPYGWQFRREMGYASHKAALPHDRATVVGQWSGLFSGV